MLRSQIYHEYYPSMSEEPKDVSGIAAEDEAGDLPPSVGGEGDEYEDSDEGEHVDAQNDNATPTGPAKKKKKSKRKKIKEALTGQKDTESSTTADSKPQISREQLNQLAQVNPTLKEELERKSPADIDEFLKKLSIGDVVTGMV